MQLLLMLALCMICNLKPKLTGQYRIPAFVTLLLLDGCTFYTKATTDMSFTYLFFILLLGHNVL